jgi:glycosyltransferase involved in cell wall biosynthesis
VVATEVGGTREISDQKDLILVQPGEVEGIKAGILQALEVLDQSGASLELVQERFGVEEAVEKYFRVLSK